MKILTAQELLNGGISKRDTIAAQLETAAKILRQHGSLESAAWRVADSGLELREMIEQRGLTNSQGVDIPTGMGAILPTRKAAHEPK